MRQLLILLSFVAATSSALAFQDVPVRQQMAKMAAQMPQQSEKDRLASLQSFKDFVYNEMNTYQGLPDIMTATDAQLAEPATAARIKDFASLSEFSVYVDNIDITAINANTCLRAQMQIVGAANVEAADLGSEAKDALQILVDLGCTLK